MVFPLYIYRYQRAISEMMVQNTCKEAIEILGASADKDEVCLCVCINILADLHVPGKALRCITCVYRVILRIELGPVLHVHVPGTALRCITCVYRVILMIELGPVLHVPGTTLRCITCVYRVILRIELGPVLHVPGTTLRCITCVYRVNFEDRVGSSTTCTWNNTELYMYYMCI